MTHRPEPKERKGQITLVYWFPLWPSAGGLTVSAGTALSTDFLSSVYAGTSFEADRKLSITVTPNASITNKVMEAFFQEIITSPCTAQDATPESFEVSTLGSGSAEVNLIPDGNF